jgi:IS4 transposase
MVVVHDCTSLTPGRNIKKSVQDFYGGSYYRTKITRREIELLTNHLRFGAATIGRIYRDRGETERFFKVLK